MKKIVCISLTAVLLLLCCMCPVSAQGEALVAVCGSAAGEAGDTVDIPITITENPGISGVMLSVNYDPDILELTSTDTGTDDFPGNFLVSGTDLLTIPYNVTWTANTSLHTSYTGTGLFATLHFKIKDGAPAGETPLTLGYSANSTFDVNLQNVACTTVSGSVSVAGWRFSSDCTLRLWEGDYQTYVTGLDPDLPEVTGHVDTFGGWSYYVEENSTGNESTGAVLNILNKAGTVVESYELVYFGDVNGDGEISPNDASITIAASNLSLGNEWEDCVEAPEFARSMAADVNHDDEITPFDASIIITAANVIFEINQEWMAKGDPSTIKGS